MLETFSSLTYKQRSAAVYSALATPLTSYVGEYDMADSINTELFYIPQVRCKYGHELRYKKNNKCVRCRRIQGTGHDDWQSSLIHFRSNYAANPTVHQAPFWNAVCIPLSSGNHCIIDIDDFYKIPTGRWSFNNGYASNKGALMHRIITNAPSNKMVDHINGNKLDNRKFNLRIANCAENSRNSKPQKHGVSPYKGVSYSKFTNSWQAGIHFMGKSKFIGRFDSQIEAAKAYDKAAMENFGEFAWLNFPKEKSHDQE